MTPSIPSFEDIFERYHGQVMHWCYPFAKDRDMALDLAQEVFLKVFRSLPAFRGDSRLSTWIYTITRHHCLSALRKRRTEPEFQELPMHLGGEHGREFHRATEQRERFRHFMDGLRRTLTPIEIRALWLHYAHGFTLPAITQEFGLRNRSGAKALIVSARRKVKAAGIISRAPR